MELLEQRRQQVLEGKRSWNVMDDAGGDFDLFYSHIIVPLRKLMQAGFFGQLREHEGKYPEGRRFDRADIIGAINYNGKTDD